MKRILALGLAWTTLVGGTAADDIATLLEQNKPIEAFVLAQQTAAAGDPEGDFALGWFYDKGDHISVDKGKAVEHYRRCADAGLAPCEWRLGVMYDTGDGVSEDSETAFALISKAAAQGNILATTSLAVLYANARGTAVDYAKAMALYKVAAKGGEPQGFNGVAILYLNGQGVDADEETALAWFAVAAAIGDEPIKEFVETAMQGKDNATLDRVRDKAESIYTEYVGPLAKPVPATRP